MIVYPIGNSGQSVVLNELVVRHLARHRQLRCRRLEAGGQLFARFDGSEIVIVEATGPRRRDRRSRTSYVPDRRAEQKEIEERHGRGLHFVGDWHTHPEARPTPSETDVRNIADCFKRSTHALNGFILIVVGRANAPGGLHVSLYDGVNRLVLWPARCENSANLPAVQPNTQIVSGRW